MTKMPSVCGFWPSAFWPLLFFDWGSVESFRGNSAQDRQHVFGINSRLFVLKDHTKTSGVLPHDSGVDSAFYGDPVSQATASLVLGALCLGTV